MKYTLRYAGAAGEEMVGGFDTRDQAYAYAEMKQVPTYVVAPAEGEPEEGVNPKDRQGAKKVPLGLLPDVGVIYGVMAARYGAFEAVRADGGKGYGPFNWRDEKIAATIYLDALERHIKALRDGQDLDPKSKVHHLGHVIAGASIYLDAMETGNLIDNRNKSGVVAELIERFSVAA